MPRRLATPTDTDQRPRRLGRVLLRTATVVLSLLVIAGIGAALWVLDHTRLRHDHFEARHGVLVDAAVGELQREGEGYYSQAVSLEADTGLAVDLRVLRPYGDEPRPLMVVLGGHRTGQDAVQLIGDPGDVVVAALDYPYHGPDSMRTIPAIIRGVGAIQRGLLDTPPAVSQALDWLIEQPWVDADRVELVGVSLGTPFVAVAGALDERFRRVWVIHGGAGNAGWIEHNIDRRVGAGWMQRPLAHLAHTLAYGASFDTEWWVSRIAPRELVVIGATDDERLPAHKVKRLYHAAGQPRELIWTEGQHVDPRRPDIVQDLLAIVRKRMDEGVDGPAPTDVASPGLNPVESSRLR